MVLCSEREQIKVRIVQEKNLEHPNKATRGRNKLMKKENPKILGVQKVLSTYDISKNVTS